MPSRKKVDDFSYFNNPSTSKTEELLSFRAMIVSHSAVDASFQLVQADGGKTRELLIENDVYENDDGKGMIMR